MSQPLLTLPLGKSPVVRPIAVLDDSARNVSYRRSDAAAIYGEPDLRIEYGDDLVSCCGYALKN